MSSAADEPMARTARAIARDVPELDTAAFETFLAMRHVAAEFHSAVHTHFGRYRVSPPRFGLLVVLAYGEEGGLTPAQLADELGVTRATMTGFLDGLERDELITRERHPDDRRMVIIRITPKARKLVERVLPDHLRRVTQAFRVLSHPEMKQLQSLMAKVRRGVAAMRKP